MEQQGRPKTIKKKKKQEVLSIDINSHPNFHALANHLNSEPTTGRPHKIVKAEHTRENLAKNRKRENTRDRVYDSEEFDASRFMRKKKKDNSESFGFPLDIDSLVFIGG